MYAYEAVYWRAYDAAKAARAWLRRLSVGAVEERPL
jgi:hypothetical protein